MKSSVVAFILSLILPGLGFLYLGRWGWAIFNFIGALGVGEILSFTLSDETFDNIIRPTAIGIGLVSGALAVVVTKQMNSEY